MIKEHFTDAEKFFATIKQYAEAIKGTVLVADEAPYVGFVVYRDSGTDEMAKHFLIGAKYLNLGSISEGLRQMMRSQEGRRNWAKTLTP